MGSSSSTMLRSKGRSASTASSKLISDSPSQAKNGGTPHPETSGTESSSTAPPPPPPPPPLSAPKPPPQPPSGQPPPPPPPLPPLSAPKPPPQPPSGQPPPPPQHQQQQQASGANILDTTSLKGKLFNNKGTIQDPSLLDKWKNKLSKFDLMEHDRQSAMKLIAEHQNTLCDQFESSLQCVSLMKDSKDINYLEKLNLLFFEIEIPERTILGDFLAHIHFPSKSLNFYKKTLKDIGYTHFNDTIQATLKNMDDNVKQIVFLVRSNWWNFSDASVLFCANLATSGILQEVIQDMQNVSSASAIHLKHSFTFESGIGILHNTAKLSSQRQTFRDLKVVDILGPFLDHSSLPKITMLVLLTLAYIIDEDQTDLLFSHESSFNLLLHLSKRAWKTSDLRYEGFSFGELLDGMLGLSKNDKVKRVLVEQGALDVIDSVLNYNGIEEEKLSATKLLWELAFDPENKKIIKDRKSLMDVVKSLSTKDGGKISRPAQGVLWVLDFGKTEINNKRKKKKESEKRKISRGHLMISYNWGDQKKLIEIKDMLRANNYNVWMDIENISGSTLQAMAEAVEKSEAVLVCMSERYKESPNCRAEAEYAFSLKKPIIPLLMQTSYKPDGWLGILLGTKLFFDFSGKYDFNSKSTELMKELGNFGQGDTMHSKSDDVDGPIIKEIVPSVSKIPIVENNKLDVQEWIKDNKLTKVTRLQNLTPEHLIFLKKISTRAPEYYYKFMMDFLQGNITADNLDTLMLVTGAIEKLPRT